MALVTVICLENRARVLHSLGTVFVVLQLPRTIDSCSSSSCHDPCGDSINTHLPALRSSRDGDDATLASSSMSVKAAALGSSRKLVILVCFVPMAPCRVHRSRQSVPAGVVRLLAALNNRAIRHLMNTTTVVIRTGVEELTYGICV